MSLAQNLDEVFNAAYYLSQGVNALGLMAMGLSDAHDPYADGFSALYNYLFHADQELHKYLDACMEVI